MEKKSAELRLCQNGETELCMALLLRILIILIRDMENLR